jgi:hypothetical protein
MLEPTHSDDPIARARRAEKALAGIVALIDAVASECGFPPEGAAQAVTLLKPDEAARLYALAKGEAAP